MRARSIPAGEAAVHVVAQRLRPAVLEHPRVGLERDVRVDQRGAAEPASGEHADVLADVEGEQRAAVADVAARRAHLGRVTGLRERVGVVARKDLAPAFQHAHAAPGARETRRGDRRAVARPDHHDVVVVVQVLEIRSDRLPLHACLLVPDRIRAPVVRQSHRVRDLGRDEHVAGLVHPGELQRLLDAQVEHLVPLVHERRRGGVQAVPLGLVRVDELGHAPSERARRTCGANPDGGVGGPLLVAAHRDRLEPLVEQDHRRALDAVVGDRVDDPAAGVEHLDRIPRCRRRHDAFERLVGVAEHERELVRHVAEVVLELAPHRVVEVLPEPGEPGRRERRRRLVPLALRAEARHVPEDALDDASAAAVDEPALGPDPVADGVAESLDELVGGVRARQHLVDARDVGTGCTRLSQRRPEEVDPRVVLGLPVVDVQRLGVVGEDHALHRADEPVDALDEVAVVEHRDPVTLLGAQTEVGIRRHDPHVLAAGATLDQQREQLIGGGVVVVPGERRGVGLGLEVPTRRRRADAERLATLAELLPQVVVVVARDVADGRREPTVARRERLRHELVEHHSRDAGAHQRELEHVAHEHEGRQRRRLVRVDERPERVEQRDEDGTGIVDVHLGGVLEPREDAAPCAEVQIRQAHVPDVRHGTPPPRTASPTVRLPPLGPEPRPVLVGHRTGARSPATSAGLRRASLSPGVCPTHDGALHADVGSPSSTGTRPWWPSRSRSSAAGATDDAARRRACIARL